MAYLVKRIKDIKDRKEDGEEKMYYWCQLVDKDADEQITMRLSKLPKFNPSDVVSFVVESKQERLEPAGEADKDGENSKDRA